MTDEIETELRFGAMSEDIAPDLQCKVALIRAVEERLLKLFSEGKIFGTVHTCIGQEWTGVAIAEALIADDIVFTNHRGHGHFLARTDDVEGLIAEVMGKATGVCGGRGGSQHLCSRGVFSNGIQGGIVPVAAGIAMAQKLRKTGAIAVVFIGDGTLGEGVVYETFNIASKWALPLLIVLENNQYSQSTAQMETLAGAIEARAAAFGIETSRGNTWNPAELMVKAAECARAVRDGGNPHFFQIDTYRLMPHSKGDDLRDTAELTKYWARDPFVLFSQANPSVAEEMAETVARRIDCAVANADAAGYATDVAVQPSSLDRPVEWQTTRFEAVDRGVVAIHNALLRHMLRDNRIILIGEDIEGPYGGAFKVTKNLSLEFPDRVRNTPISESAIVGLGNGLALSGMIPVCEIMFGDFLTLAADQIINHASKFAYMYNDKVQLRLIIRTPMGGRRAYGPTHSQCLEKHFLGLPGTRVLALHNRYDPGMLYDTLFATIDCPTIVIENKLLYGTRVGAMATAGFALEHTNELFPTTRLRPEGDIDVTILCYGGMLPEVEAALDPLFDEEEVVCEVICPTQLYPLNLKPIAESVLRSGRLLIAEEGLGFAAFGAEVIAQLAEVVPGALRQVRRIASPNHPIPSCGSLEKLLLPSTRHLIAAVRDLVAP